MFERGSPFSLATYLQKIRRYTALKDAQAVGDDDHEAKLPAEEYHDNVTHNESERLNRHWLWRADTSTHFTASALPPLQLLVIFVAVLGLLVGEYMILRPSAPALPGQPMTVVPPVSKVVQSFAKDLNFVKAPNKHNAEELNTTWDALLPPGRGFVLIEDNLKYKLHTGLPTGDGDARFSISMFHQLHCLDYVRRRLYQIILKLQDGRASEIDLSYEDQVEHLPHCLDYIRQGIMCAGDTSLEGAIKSDLGTVIFGIGSQHVCKDFKAIYDFTAQHADFDF